MSYDPNGPFKVIGREYRGSHTINELQSVQYGFNLHCRESVQYPFQLGTLVNLVKTDEKPFVIFPVWINLSLTLKISHVKLKT